MDKAERSKILSRRSLGLSTANKVPPAPGRQSAFWRVNLKSRVEIFKNICQVSLLKGPFAFSSKVFLP
jgi:hypothetical protein